MPFKPGECGNPLGIRSRHVRYERAIRNAISPERVMKIAEALAIAAENGDVDAARVLFDRLMGKPKEKVEVSVTHVLQGLSREEIRQKLLEQYEKRGLVLKNVTPELTNGANERNP